MDFTMPEDGTCTVCHNEATLLPMERNEPPTHCLSCFQEQVALWELCQEMEDEKARMAFPRYRLVRRPSHDQT